MKYIENKNKQLRKSQKIYNDILVLNIYIKKTYLEIIGFNEYIYY